MLPSLLSKPTTSPPSSGAGSHSAAGLRARPISVAVAVALHRAYKVLISPLFAGSCRFEPSCADYMRDAVIARGVVRGGWIGLRRPAPGAPLRGLRFAPGPSPP